MIHEAPCRRERAPHRGLGVSHKRFLPGKQEKTRPTNTMSKEEVRPFFHSNNHFRRIYENHNAY